MTLEEAGRTLREMYTTEAGGKGKKTAIHLFGIIYDSELGGLTSLAIVREAGMGDAYHTEVANGRRLASLVRLREEHQASRDAPREF